MLIKALNPILYSFSSFTPFWTLNVTAEKFVCGVNS
jgi:hypothetical protein